MGKRPGPYATTFSAGGAGKFVVPSKLGRLFPPDIKEKDLRGESLNFKLKMTKKGG